MPAMLRRRVFALVAIFAVAFGALWPLVSTAKAGPQIPSFICSQSGFQHPGAPAEPGDDFHCPLCIATADAALPAVAASNAAPSFDAIAIAVRFATPRVRFTSTPPPSRAPPALS
ncbi:MAG TPA: DUF2946 family protein [Usitatibacter sp.]|nr:DUF2946 family protein [Usitatibacter sp.]